jgi:SAM-dependent methyltransferase
MKYYVEEHRLGYQRVVAEGKTAWKEIPGEPGFDFSLRAFLEGVLPTLEFQASRPRALEIGCGTGPGACFLAQRGFELFAIDVEPLAIKMAAEFAAERNLSIRHIVADVCQLPLNDQKYDLIVDSYCLQSIVTDSDRERVLTAVRSRLEPSGYYIVGTAVQRPDREYGEDSVLDDEPCIEYVTLTGSPRPYEDAVRIRDDWYLPHRRDLKPNDLREELEGYGYNVLIQEEGHLVCGLSSPEA